MRIIHICVVSVRHSFLDSINIGAVCGCDDEQGELASAASSLDCVRGTFFFGLGISCLEIRANRMLHNNDGGRGLDDSADPDSPGEIEAPMLTGWHSVHQLYVAGVFARTARQAIFRGIVFCI